MQALKVKLNKDSGMYRVNKGNPAFMTKKQPRRITLNGRHRHAMTSLSLTTQEHPTDREEFSRSRKEEFKWNFPGERGVLCRSIYASAGATATVHIPSLTSFYLFLLDHILTNDKKAYLDYVWKKNCRRPWIALPGNVCEEDISHPSVADSDTIAIIGSRDIILNYVWNTGVILHGKDFISDHTLIVSLL